MAMDSIITDLLDKATLDTVIGLIIGYCMIISLRSQPDYCKVYCYEEEFDTIEHFLCNCPAFSRMRMTLDKGSLESLDFLLKADIMAPQSSLCWLKAAEALFFSVGALFCLPSSDLSFFQCLFSCNLKLLKMMFLTTHFLQHQYFKRPCDTLKLLSCIPQQCFNRPTGILTDWSSIFPFHFLPLPY